MTNYRKVLGSEDVVDFERLVDLGWTIGVQICRSLQNRNCEMDHKRHARRLL